MTLRIDLLRPDDLLNLHIDGENLRLEANAVDGPALVLDNPDEPGFLIVTFPPQTVVEQAVYELPRRRRRRQTREAFHSTSLPPKRRRRARRGPGSAARAVWCSAYPQERNTPSRTT